MKILAKFSLHSIAQQRHWSEPGYATQVSFSAVQGEPFGSATPTGSIQMLIVNPDAQKFFADAWQQLVDHKIGKSPEFYVTFESADEAPATE